MKLTHNVCQVCQLSLLTLAVACVTQPAFAEQQRIQPPSATKPPATSSQIVQTAQKNQTDSTTRLQAVSEQTYSASALSVKALSETVIWRRLLHYPDGENSSRATKAKFFVSPDGKTNPMAELQAMLTAMHSKSDSSKGDESVQCRFPARTHWLKEQLRLSLPEADCSKYQQWFSANNPKRLAVIFAQEYPDSMTSAFAHTLLRVDTTENPAKNNYQDSLAINYTVDGDDSHNMGRYAVNTMIGEYSGMMTIEPYQPKIQHYLANDHRDVWTYELELTAEENRQILRHIWEVKDLGLPYYLLTDNCSSEILRLVDVVRPQSQLFAQLSQFVIPSEIIRLLDDNDLLVNAQYLPAEKSIKQARLNSQQVMQKKQATQGQFASGYADVDLGEFFADNNSINNKPTNNNPADGNDVKRASVGLGRSGEQSYAEVAGRVSYHDLLDRPNGYRQNMQMETLNIKVRAYESDSNDEVAQQVQLQEFLVLGGHSYNPINTARKGSSWGIELGAKQVMDASVNYENALEKYARQQEHLVGNISYEKGVSYAFGEPNTVYELPKQLCYAFGGGDMQVGKGLTNGFRVGAGANLGCVYQLNNRLRAKVELDAPYWYHGETGLQGRTGGYWQPIASLGMQYDLTDNQGIRLTAEHELSSRVANDTGVQLAWQWYF